MNNQMFQQMKKTQYYNDLTGLDNQQRKLASIYTEMPPQTNYLTSDFRQPQYEYLTETVYPASINSVPDPRCQSKYEQAQGIFDYLMQDQQTQQFHQQTQRNQEQTLATNYSQTENGSSDPNMNKLSSSPHFDENISQLDSAQKVIIMTLIKNKLVNQALKNRIRSEVTRAQIKIAAFIRKQRQQTILKMLKRKAIFSATLYLETNYNLPTFAKVEVFGEFSTPNCWSVRIPCEYDPKLFCFKVDVKIKIGHNFKFIVNDQTYTTSKRYAIQQDRYGNLNNMYDPKRIVWTTEKKHKSLEVIIRNKTLLYGSKSICITPEEIRSTKSLTETNSESYDDWLQQPHARGQKSSSTKHSIYSTDYSTRVRQTHMKQRYYPSHQQFGTQHMSPQNLIENFHSKKEPSQMTQEELNIRYLKTKPIFNLQLQKQLKSEQSQQAQNYSLNANQINQRLLQIMKLQLDLTGSNTFNDQNSVEHPNVHTQQNLGGTTKASNTANDEKNGSHCGGYQSLFDTKQGAHNHLSKSMCVDSSHQGEQGLSMLIAQEQSKMGQNLYGVSQQRETASQNQVSGGISSDQFRHSYTNYGTSQYYYNQLDGRVSVTQDDGGACRYESAQQDPQVGTDLIDYYNIGNAEAANMTYLSHDSQTTQQTQQNDFQPNIQHDQAFDIMINKQKSTLEENLSTIKEQANGLDGSSDDQYSSSMSSMGSHQNMPNNINQDIIDKMRRDNSQNSNFQIVLVSGGLSIGKQNKLDRKCEDAFFITEGSFGVSDGVSGWNDYGFSSNLFSQQLMQYSKDLIEKKLVEIKKEKIKGAVKLSKLDVNNKLSRKLSSLSIQQESQIGFGATEQRAMLTHRSIKHLNQANSLKLLSLKRYYKSEDRVSQQKLNLVQSCDSMGLQYLSKKAINQDALSFSENLSFKDAQNSQGAGSGVENSNAKLPIGLILPIQIMQNAYNKVNVVGSATGLIAVKQGREIRIANIGDSGFMVIRFQKEDPAISENDKTDFSPSYSEVKKAFCAYRSKEQQHSFNIPYQLSYLPTQKHLEELFEQKKYKECQKLLQVLKKKHTVCQDDPSQADEYQIHMQDQDIIIAGTDGLFDNLFKHELLDIVSTYKSRQKHQKLWKDTQAQELARIIIEAAKSKYMNTQTFQNTPYSRKFKKLFKAQWKNGGKEDDITVVVTFCHELHNKSQKSLGRI